MQASLQTGSSGAARAVSLALPLLLALSVLLSGIHQAYAQDDIPEGEITFVRLANGEPGGEGIYIINADGTDERPLFLFEDLGLPYDPRNAGYRCPVWSPDGTRLAFNGAVTETDTSYIAVVDVETGDVQLVYEVQHEDQILHNIFFPEWVPDADSDQLSFGFMDVERYTGLILTSGVRIVSLDDTGDGDSDVITLRDDIGLSDDAPLYYGGVLPNYAPFAHSWTADGEALAVTLYNWRTYLLDGDGSDQAELPSQWANGDVEWSPDGELLAVSLFRMILIDPEDGTERELVPPGETLNGSTVESLAWSPAGSEIAYTTLHMDISGDLISSFSLSVVDVESGEIRELVRTPSFAAGQYPYNLSCVDWRPVSVTSDASDM